MEKEDVNLQSVFNKIGTRIDCCKYVYHYLKDTVHHVWFENVGQTGKRGFFSNFPEGAPPPAHYDE
jgi:hypothetical protein